VTTRDPLGVTGVVLDDKFLVESPIGEGGAAIVYRGTHTRLGGKVAIKFLVSLSQAPAEEQGAIFDEFIREGKLIAELSQRSSAIVQARDMGVLERPGQPKLPYLVLEWLDGRSLDEVLVSETNSGKPPRSLAETVRLIEPIAGALAIAHERGVAHRDVKPENIFVVERPGTESAPGPGARIKLLDFGIAKVMKTRIAGIHQTGTLPTAFTPHYGAPEQFSRTYGETGTWSDVFSMALVILEIMRGGRRAFEGDEYVDLARQSANEERRPTPKNLGLTVTDEVEAVFARALAVRPMHRYAKMGELWAALLGAVDPRAAGFPLSGPSAAAAAQRKSAPPSQPALAAPAPAPSAPGSSRKIILFAGLAGLALVVSAAVAAGIKASRRGPAATASAGPPPSAPPSAGAGADRPTVVPGEALASAVPAPDAASKLCPEGAAIVNGGRFQIGSATAPEDGPRHPVLIDTFCLDRTEVTARAFSACVDAGSCSRPAPDRVESAKDRCTIGPPALEAHPANCVTFDQAATYCAFRGMRLPTEAEWEVAASRGAGGAVPWDDQGPLPERANLETKSTSPAGGLPRGSTKEGIADLLGNVAEWQADWFAPYKSGEALSPKGPETGDKRVVRGGSWSSPATFSVARREAFPPETRSASIGFRCAKSLR